MSDAPTRSNDSTAEEREFLPTQGPRSPWVTAMLVGLLLVTLSPLVLYVYYGTVHHGLALTVGPEGLSVSFGVGHIDIPVEDIANVAYVAEPPRLRRAFGAGMAGLQMGWYNLDGYGRVYRLTTVGRPLVYVDTRPDAREARPDTRYVFSPEEAERFAALLQAAVAGGVAEDVSVQNGAASGDSVVFRSMPSTSVFADAIMIVTLVLTLPIGFICLYVLRKGPVGMRYGVGPDGVSVYHFGRRRYRWDSVRAVRRIDEPLPRMWRMMGAAMPGYYTGDFKAGELGSLKVYATRLQPPLVLLETRVGKLLLSPEDVDGFLAAIAEYRPDED